MANETRRAGDWLPVEIELVEIPRSLAIEHGVQRIGTVVWYVAPATFATVECCLLSDNPDRLKTVLIDVSIADLAPVTPNSDDPTACA